MPLIIKDISDRQLQRRIEGLARHSFFGNGKLRYPENKLKEFVEAVNEAERREISFNSINPNIKENDRFPELLTSNAAVRYTKKKYAEAFISGRVRLMRADGYCSAENKGVQDNEYRRDLYMRSQCKVKIAEVEYKVLEGVIHNKVFSDFSPVRHFYNLSLSSEISQRLQRNFCADVCIKINDLDEFWNRFVEAVKRNHTDRWLKIGSISYYDALGVDLREEELMFAKDLYYSYQSEVRIVSVLKDVDDEWIEFGLGDLGDIVSLTSL